MENKSKRKGTDATSVRGTAGTDTTRSGMGSSSINELEGLGATGSTSINTSRNNETDVNSEKRKTEADSEDSRKDAGSNRS